MEVMRRAVIRRETLRPLPGEITDIRIREASLPLKIEVARQAIAACKDLSELLKMKDQAEGLSAAVRVMKHVGPEMIHNANCLLADAWRKGGELLNQYSNVPGKPQRIIDKNGRVGSAPTISPRGQAMIDSGLPRLQGLDMVRISKAPEGLVESLVQTHTSLARIADRTPPVVNRAYHPVAHSEVGRPIFRGLCMAATALRPIDMKTLAQLTADERKRVKAKIVEIQELLDQMDQLCK